MQETAKIICDIRTGNTDRISNAVFNVGSQNTTTAAANAITTQIIALVADRLADENKPLPISIRIDIS